MSTIFINAGQCGNQLGYSLLDSLYSHLSCPGINLSEDDREEEMNSFFRLSNSKKNRRFARAVCLDTEPKVVNECLGRANEHKQYWNYDPRSVAYRHGGAGNNWAMGYDMCRGEFMDASLDCIRKELEHCDQSATLVVTHSVAGGTGSGLGTHLTEAIEDEFPDTIRVNFAITPYHFGEVVVQHYNTVLCLSKISLASNSVLIFENEVAQDLCKKMKGIERPSLKDINSLIAANIVPILLPKYNTSLNYNSNGLSSRVSVKTKSHFSDDIIHLCSHPGYRFIDVKTTPQTSNKSIDFTYDSWSSVLNTLEKMQIRGTPSERGLGTGSSNSEYGHRSIGSVLILRGPDSISTSLAINTTLNTIPNPLNNINKSSLNSPNPKENNNMRISKSVNSPTNNNHPGLTFEASYSKIIDLEAVKISHSAHVTNGYQRSASLISNGQAILPILQRSANKAAEMFRVGAYVHQYEACGLDEDNFVSAFRQLGQVIENYKSL